MSMTNAFGLPKDEETPGADPYADEEPEAVAEAPVEEAPAAETPAPEPEKTHADPLAPEPEPETALDEAPAEEPEVTATPYEGRYKDKYASLEAMEEAHRNALDLAQRQAQERNQARQENMQLMEYLRLAAERLQQMEQQVKTPAAQPQDDMVDPDVRAMAERIAQEQVAQQVTPLQQQMQMQQAQQQQQQYASEINQQIQQFRGGHELDPETELSMVGVFEELDLDPTFNVNYDIALEVVQNPAFGQALRAVPDRLLTVEGLEEARRIAGVTQVVTPTQPVADIATARARAAVESGGGSPPGGDDADAARRAAEEDPDSWESVLASARKDRSKSAFGI